MASNEEPIEEIDSNGDSFQKVKQKLKDRSKKVAQTKEMLSKQANQTKQVISKQAVKIAKQAEEHESFISKVTHLLGVLGFGGFCFLLGARPQDIPYVYCLFYVIFVPLRWIYYRFKKWHYYLLDFCYYANTIFLVDLLLYPKNEKLFMVCFSFAEGPLAWAIIVWRCSLVFSSLDKIVSVLVHLLPDKGLSNIESLLNVPNNAQKGYCNWIVYKLAIIPLILKLIIPAGHVRKK